MTISTNTACLYMRYHERSFVVCISTRKGYKGDKIVTGYNSGKGHAMAQLVEALRYKPEGRVFDSRWVSLRFFY